MNNKEFLQVISDSFQQFLKSGTSRSTAKLKPLHGAIAKDIQCRLGGEYNVKSQGWGDDKEAKVQGRYIDKMVDITIQHKGKDVGGIAIKFVMQNYSQNSNNYFENMLGETANIRCNSIPYFQIFIILDKLPYYNKQKKITRWETFSKHNVNKYTALSQDNVDKFMHAPNKTLIYVIHIPDNEYLENANDYIEYYRQSKPQICLSQNNYDSFSSAVILNNYELFISKVYHTIEAL